MNPSALVESFDIVESEDEPSATFERPAQRIVQRGQLRASTDETTCAGLRHASWMVQQSGFRRPDGVTP